MPRADAAHFPIQKRNAIKADEVGKSGDQRKHLQTLHPKYLANASPWCPRDVPQETNGTPRTRLCSQRRYLASTIISLASSATLRPRETTNPDEDLWQCVGRRCFCTRALQYLLAAHGLYHVTQISVSRSSSRCRRIVSEMVFYSWCSCINKWGSGRTFEVPREPVSV